MPLDVDDYEKITRMIGRVEAKLDALRRDFVGADVQKLVNEKVDDRFKGVDKRIDDLESTSDKWIMRVLVMAALLFSFFQLLVSLKVLP